jgi:hypothetical protein
LAGTGNSDELKTLIGIDAMLTLVLMGALVVMDALGVASLMDVIENFLGALFG